MSVVELLDKTESIVNLESSSAASPFLIYKQLAIA
jgi:hypothetical protein